MTVTTSETESQWVDHAISYPVHRRNRMYLNEVGGVGLCVSCCVWECVRCATSCGLSPLTPTLVRYSLETTCRPLTEPGFEPRGSQKLPPWRAHTLTTRAISEWLTFGISRRASPNHPQSQHALPRCESSTTIRQRLVPAPTHHTGGLTIPLLPYVVFGDASDAPRHVDSHHLPPPLWGTH